jgi:hypothetical protein
MISWRRLSSSSGCADTDDGEEGRGRRRLLLAIAEQEWGLAVSIFSSSGAKGKVRKLFFYCVNCIRNSVWFETVLIIRK